MILQKHIRLAEIFYLLSNEKRLGILRMIDSFGPQSVSALAEYVDLSVHATSKHLRLLEDHRILQSSIDGNFRVYDFRPRIPKIMTSIIKKL